MRIFNGLFHFVMPVNANQWTGAGFNHSFFPLVQGHSGPHRHRVPYVRIYSDEVLNAALSINRIIWQLQIRAFMPWVPLTCNICNSLEPGWKPASFTEHILNHFRYIPENTKEHGSCTECHTQFSSYSADNMSHHCMSIIRPPWMTSTMKWVVIHIQAGLLQCHPRGVAMINNYQWKAVIVIFWIFWSLTELRGQSPAENLIGGFLYKLSECLCKV